MIDPKDKSLRLLTVREASSREVARAEMQKVADSIHYWLYGIEPAPLLRTQMVRVERDGERRKTYLN